MKPFAIFFHGNPGTPYDFDAIRAALSYPSLSLRPDEKELSASRKERGGAPWILVAYSWAAYWALSTWPKMKDPPARLVLIAPYLEDNNPMPTALQKVLSIGPLRRLIVKKAFSKWESDFLKRLFSSAVPENFDREALAASLKDPQSWNTVVERKLLQNQKPLPGENLKISCPVDVILGTKDVISPLSKIKHKLELCLPQAHFHDLAEASHGMLWTDAPTLARKLDKIMEKL